MVQMQVFSVGQVQNSQEHLLILREQDGQRLLPISIGLYEATAIAVGAESIHMPRPMTHDLLAAVISRMQGSLARVVIHDLRDETFICQLEIVTEKGVIEVDCRPSDAVAVALRTESPIFVTEEVLAQAAVVADRSLREEQEQQNEE
jgi:bifunctional DNase/RNase